MAKFRMAKNGEAGDNRLICWTGQDAQGNHFNVTTDSIHGSELSDYSRGAEGDAILIAQLLDWYYRDPERAQQCFHTDETRADTAPEVCEHGFADTCPENCN